MRVGLYKRKKNKKVKKKENTLSTEKATKKRKNENGQEKKKRKHVLDQGSKIQAKTITMTIKKKEGNGKLDIMQRTQEDKNM